MASKTTRYTPEFKRQMVDLVRNGRTPASLGKEYGPSAWTIGNWVKQEARDLAGAETGVRHASFGLEPVAIR